MSNIIKVKEDKNILSFDGDVLNVVANSTNFYLQVELDEEWQDCSLVTVVFSFRGQKEYVDLDENYTCQIPPFEPGRVLFSLYGVVSENEKVSSTILELFIEPSLGSYTESVEPYQNAHAELLGILSKLQSGDIVAKKALEADSATTAGSATSADSATYATTAGSSNTEVSLTGDQTITGTKNFTGTLQKSGKEVASVAEISNPNLLINGDFRVNQRGASSYTGSGSRLYTVDRWCITSSASVTSINSNSVSVSFIAQYQAFEQKIEDYEKLKGKTVTLSCKISNVTISSGNQLFLRYNSGDTNGTKQISGDGTYSLTFTVSNSATLLAMQIFSGSGAGVTYSFDLEWMKLEIGSVATPFSPRPYAEELALCQRYYEKIDVSNNANRYNIYKTARNTTQFYDGLIKFMKTKRTPPTLTLYSTNHTTGKLRNLTQNNAEQNFSTSYITIDSFEISNTNGDMAANDNIIGYYSADAELY